MAGVSARFQLMFWSSDVVGCPLCVCVWCGLCVCGLRRVCVDGASGDSHRWCDVTVSCRTPNSRTLVYGCSLRLACASGV